MDANLGLTLVTLVALAIAFSIVAGGYAARLMLHAAAGRRKNGDSNDR